MVPGGQGVRGPQVHWTPSRPPPQERGGERLASLLAAIRNT